MHVLYGSVGLRVDGRVFHLAVGLLGLYPAVVPVLFPHPSPCFTFLLFPWAWVWGKYLTQLLLISLVVHNSLPLCPVNEDTDVIELPHPRPPLLPSLFLTLPSVFCVLWHFPSSEPRFNAAVALSPVLRNCAAVVLRCILHLLFPRQDGHRGKRWPRKLTFIPVF